MAERTKLDLIGEEARNNHIIKNTFNDVTDENHYSRTHTRAMSDEETPVHGKGTGVELDTANGGGSVDINGDASVAGSGRKGNIKFNQYNKNNPYQRPTM
jgi:hypothetical protein